MKLQDFEKKLKERVVHFGTQLSALRVGTLSLDSVGSLKVTAYSTVMTLRELGNLTVSSPGEVVVSCFDKGVVGEVEKSLRDISGGGFSVTVDGDLIRLKVAALTQERREALVKEIGQIKEETKVAIRLVRQDQMRSLDEMEEQDEISKDDKFRQRSEVEEQIKKINLEIDRLADEKISQITTL